MENLKKMLIGEDKHKLRNNEDVLNKAKGLKEAKKVKEQAEN